MRVKQYNINVVNTNSEEYNMIVKIKYPNTAVGIKNAMQHKDSINKEYKSYTQPFPQAEIVVLTTHTSLYYYK